MRRIFVLCLLGLLFSGGPLGALESWELLKEEEGIRVYRRDFPDRYFDAFKAETIIHARIEVIGMVLRDVTAYPEWMPNCLKTRIIEQFDEQNFVIHQVNKTPFPLKSRDSVVKATTTIDWKNGSFTVDLRSIDDQRVPPSPNRVRITTLTGQWQMEYIDRERALVRYMIYIDPGGSVPKSMARKRLQGSPLRMLQSLRAAVKNPVYHEVAAQSEDRKIIEEYIKLGFLQK